MLVAVVRQSRNVQRAVELGHTFAFACGFMYSILRSGIGLHLGVKGASWARGVGLVEH
jgi:hypothetical protein